MLTALCGKLHVHRWLLCPSVLLLVSSAAHALSASSNPNTGSYTVAWSAVSGAFSYTLEETIGGATTSYQFFGTTTLEKSFSGKAVGSYVYRIRACWIDWGSPGSELDPDNCDYIGDPLIVRVTPPVPTGLDGPSIDYNGDFTVEWNTASGFTSKLRERLNSGTWQVVHSGSAESDFRPNRTPGTWRYSVSACKGSNCSSWSSSIAVPVPSPPPVPTGLDGPTADYNGAFNMSWNSSARATGYRLYELRPNDTAGTYTVSGTSKNIVGKLDAPGTYSYRVRGCMPESVCGSWSGYVHVVVEGIPDTPTGLDGPEGIVPQNESYTVSWNETDSGSYELEERLAGGDWQFVPPSSRSPSRTLSNAAGMYSYHVCACHPENVCSGWSSPVTVTVKAPYMTTYQYDAQGRLTEVQHPNDVVTTYGYDSAGNRTSKESLSGN